MKLYHATKKENEDNILNNGLVATEGMQNDLDEIGVYGFDNLSDALNFGIDQGWENEFDVFSFDVNDAEKDPEYDDGAYVVHHNVSDVELVENNW